VVAGAPWFSAQAQTRSGSSPVAMKRRSFQKREDPKLEVSLLGSALHIVPGSQYLNLACTSISQASAAGAGKSTRCRAKQLVKAAPPVVQAALGPDGVLQQEMLLAPYTRFRDLLHLSTAARWLKPFRFHLGSLRLRVPRELCGNRVKVLKMATSLLGVQQRIVRLRIEAGWLVVPALTAIQTGVSQGKTLQSLDISAVPPLSRKEYESLSAALISGTCPALAVLQIRARHLTDEELGYFVAVIRAGALRQLRELILAADDSVWHWRSNSAGVTELMGALEAGGCPMLTKLSLTCCRIEQTGFDALARAVRGGSLSHLQALELERCGGGDGAGAVLMEALAEGGCPSLQKLDTSRMSLTTHGDMLPLLTALGERRLRQLRSLTLRRDQIAHAGMLALSEAILEGQELEELSIWSPWGGYGQGLLTDQDYLLLVRLRSPGGVGDNSYTESLS
jgi:hypothetical protein